MKQQFRLNFGSLALLFIAITFLGCANKSSDYIIELKTNGQYEISFGSSGKATKSETEFGRTSHLNIKVDDISKNKIPKEFQSIGNYSKSTYTMNQEKDSICRNFKIETTICLDTIMFNGSHNFFKNDRVNHSLKGHSKHGVTEIVNKADTLNYVVTTTFDFTLVGEVKGRSNDLLIDYLIEKELLKEYLPDILKAIMDDNKLSSPYSHLRQDS